MRRNPVQSSVRASRLSLYEFCPETIELGIYAVLGGTDITWADCLFPINGINNAVFSVLWFWLTGVFAMSACGFLHKGIQMLPCNARLFLGRHLRANGAYNCEDNGSILDFIEKCSTDVVLVLRLYQVELDDTLMGEVIVQLCHNYKLERNLG